MAAGLIAAGMAAPIVGGLLGQKMSEEDRKRAEQYAREAAGMYDNIENPEFQNIDPVALEEYAYQGDLANEQMGPSAFESISLDPATRDAQMEALAYMQNLGSEGGMNAMDRAKLSEMQSAIGQQERGNRQAISQNMAQRGVSGSGMELMNQLMNNQAAADRSSQEGMQLQAISQQRALDAMMQAGQLGGQIRGQDYGQASQKASAMDAIAKYNNAGLNQTNQYNHSNKQQHSNMNTDIGNQNTANVQAASSANNQLKQQDFGNTMAVTQGKATGQTNLSNMYGNKASDTQAMYGGVGQGVGQGLMAYDRYGDEKK